MAWLVPPCQHEIVLSLTTRLFCRQVLQKLLRHYMKRRDKVLVFSLSTKVQYMLCVVQCVNVLMFVSLSMHAHIAAMVNLLIENIIDGPTWRCLNA